MTASSDSNAARGPDRSGPLADALRKAEEARRDAESALRAAEARFAGIVSISVDAIITVNGSQEIVLFNEGAEAIFGYEASEVLGQSLDLLIPERFRARHGQRLEEFRAAPRAARRMGERGQIHGRRKNGEEFPAEASISKVEIDGDWSFSVVMRDVTDQVRDQQALEREARELSRSNLELEAFASVASHDLQEPLRKIRAFGDRLRAGAEGRLDEQERNYLDRMLDAASRMSALINDLLAYARVTSRGSPFERVELSEVVQEALSDLEFALSESGATVEVADLPALEADRVQMRLLFLNLLGNALKYRREGVPPFVTVRGTNRPGRPSSVVIEVRDNGIGFDEKYRDRIFELFQRLHGRGQYDGTGLGLAICRKIVERHGGAITAAATPGKGAAFSVTMPLTAQVGAEGLP